MRRRTFAIVSLVLVALGAGAWTASYVLPEPLIEKPVAPSYSEEGIDPNVPAASVDEDAMRALAIESCQCARGSDGSEMANKECWEKYNAATSQFKTSNLASACEPISTEIECVATEEGEKCWIVGFGYGEVCTLEDAAAVQQAWSTALEADAGNSAATESAIHDVLARLKRGEAMEVSANNGGC